jgi:flagellar protein FliS
MYKDIMQHSNYLESKVLTAPPQRLQLMLIEGAIRFGRQAEAALRDGDRVAASGSLLRAMDIIGELLAAARANTSELNKSVADLYWYLFRRISEAKINSDLVALAETLRLLDFERQTWQMLCDNLSADKQSGPAAPHLNTFSTGGKVDSKSSFSLEA